MPEIEFTQYLRPDGRRTPITIDMPLDIWTKAEAIQALGYRFEAEVLIDGTVSLTIAGKNVDVGIELIFDQTPEKIDAAVTKLINDFDAEEARKIDDGEDD